MSAPAPGFSTAGSVAVDAGDLPFGGGLLAIVRPALDLLEPVSYTHLTLPTILRV